ncbi:MAG: iron-containing alcohol dehydrogenase [Candidatus Omnitrophica bacterium]|nr:iron-containing alcohol dehydrogenase [Candidatus Omnitrophota bacterium]
MQNFIFFNPTCVYFGKGQVCNLSGELKKRAKRVLVVTGGGSVKKNGILDEVLEQVDKAGVEYTDLSGIKPNPRLESVYEGIDICRSEKIDFLLPVGGGSVIDAAKAIAAGVPYEGDVWDFFEGGECPAEALPLGTVLTLAATGTEMNPNTVISREGSKRKVPLISPCLQPVFSILDPVYTFSVNRYHTAAGIADIMAHIFESYLTPFEMDAAAQDAIAEGLLRVCIEYGPVCVESPRDYGARANIMWTSTLALNGLLGKGKIADWTLHMIEHEISAVYDISHGAGLAILLPAFMSRMAEKYGPEKIARYGRNVWGISPEDPPEEAAKEAIELTRAFLISIGLPSSLGGIGIDNPDTDAMAQNTVKVRASLEGLDQFSETEIKRLLEDVL